MRHLRIPTLVTVLALLAACTGGGTPSSSVTPISEIGEPEDALNLIIWAGYAERGDTDPAFDWVTPFEEETGCAVNVQEMTDSNNGVSLMQSGEYDGISASGDATTRLIAAGLVSPVDTSMFENYGNVFEGLKDLSHNTVDGLNYGIPHGRGPNLLAYNTDEVTEAPTSWDIVFSDEYAGQISIYDSSIYIADAALHLMTTQPDLGITNPYQLSQAQFDAAVALLEEQAANDALYWGTYADQVASFASGEVVAGTTWQFMVNLLQADENAPPIEAVLPDEGSTGWSDTWMIHSEAEHPNCMLLWMDHMMSAEANGQATVWFGEAPTSPQACEVADGLVEGHCDLTHATDEAYYDKIWYWATPRNDCADQDSATTCVDQATWAEAWTTLTGN